MIGVFDSGFGGYYTLGLLQKSFPDFDFIFYADTKNVPYGDKNPQEIRDLTFAGLNYLFNNGAKIVILACNTASAYSIKQWQALYPEKKVLSVTIPAVEKLLENKYVNIGLLATNATISSDIYRKKIDELGIKNINLFQVGCPLLVDLVENQETNKQLILTQILDCKNKLNYKNIDALILGCTHFPLLEKYIKQVFNCEIIDPSYESVLKLKQYFKKHKNIFNSITKNGKTIIYTTGENNFL